MSSQGFSFPPPPPPPPASTLQQQTPPSYHHHHAGRNPGHGYRGGGARGASGGSHRGRGRGGNLSSRGSGRGAAHFRPRDNTLYRANAPQPPQSGYPPANYNNAYQQNPNPNQPQFHHPSPSANHLNPQQHYNPPFSQPHHPHTYHAPHQQQVHHQHQTHAYPPRPHSHPYPQQSGSPVQPAPVTPRPAGGYHQQPAYPQYPPHVPTAGYNAQAQAPQHGHIPNAPHTDPPVMGPPMRWGFEDTNKPKPYNQDNRGQRPTNRHSRDQRQPQNYKDQHRGADKFGKRGNNNNNKRPHSAAFGKQQNHSARVSAPPPVPSFGNPLPSKPPASVDATRKPKKKRRQNQLGLTPQTEEHESSEEEDDADEEARLAKALASQPDQLQFSYKGKTSTLKSSSDIASWIQERKSRFPTRARIEAKNKELAEKKRAAEEAKRQQKERQEEEKKQLKKAKAEKEKEKSERKAREEADKGQMDATMRAKMKAEKLRRKLIKEEERIARAEASAEKARLKAEGLKQEVNGDSGGADSTQLSKEEADPHKVMGAQENTSTTEANGTKPAEVHEESLSGKEDPALAAGERPNIDGASSNATDGNHKELDVSDDDSISISSSSSDPSSDSSSSGDSDESSSEEDGDEAPEALSSKSQGPVRVDPPPRQGPKKAKVCREFMRSKRCSRGKKCMYSHEVAKERGAKAAEGDKKERKGLLQALLGRQREDENRRVMEAIVTLGENGALDEPAAAPADSTKGPDAEIGISEEGRG